MGAQHRTREYVATYRALRKAQANGVWLTCAQPICLMVSRDIAPTMPIDVAHDDSGTVILGPAHRHCNRSDGAKRGNRMRGARRRRWAL